jgi:hypothetical protein
MYLKTGWLDRSVRDVATEFRVGIPATAKLPPESAHTDFGLWKAATTVAGEKHPIAGWLSIPVASQ